jgi:hypothetical protein
MKNEITPSQFKNIIKITRYLNNQNFKDLFIAYLLNENLTNIGDIEDITINDIEHINKIYNIYINQNYIIGGLFNSDIIDLLNEKIEDGEDKKCLI